MSDIIYKNASMCIPEDMIVPGISIISKRDSKNSFTITKADKVTKLITYHGSMFNGSYSSKFEKYNDNYYWIIDDIFILNSPTKITLKEFLEEESE